MPRAYERYWVNERGIVCGNAGPPDNLPVELGSLYSIMEHYFELHRERYGSAPGTDSTEGAKDAGARQEA